MAAGNGFIDFTPDTRFGTADEVVIAGKALAQRFTAPGSGTLEITAIGGYLSDTGTDTTFRLAIFTDDAANTCPTSLVANSDIEVSATTGVTSLITASYTGTKPQITGGQVYWIAVFAGAYDGAIRRNDSGGTAVYKTGLSYPTWPDGDAWHTHTDTARDYSLFAVYQAAATARPSSDVAGGTFRSILVTAPFGPRVIA